MIYEKIKCFHCYTPFYLSGLKQCPKCGWLHRTELPDYRPVGVIVRKFGKTKMYALDPIFTGENRKLFEALPESLKKTVLRIFENRPLSGNQHTYIYKLRDKYKTGQLQRSLDRYRRLDQPVKNQTALAKFVLAEYLMEYFGRHRKPVEPLKLEVEEE